MKEILNESIPKCTPVADGYINVVLESELPQLRASMYSCLRDGLDSPLLTLAPQTEVQMLLSLEHTFYQMHGRMPDTKKSLG